MLVAHVAVLLHVKRFVSIYRLCNAKIAYNLIDLHFTAECLWTLRKFARIHVKMLLSRLFEMLRLEQASIVKKSLLAISMMVAIAKIIGGLCLLLSLRDKKITNKTVHGRH